MTLQSQQLVLGARILGDLMVLDLEERRRHLYVIGQTGTGKSTLLLNLIRQDIKVGSGLALLDPHGDLAEAVLMHIPKDRTNQFVYLNPADAERPIGFNPLSAVPEDLKPIVANDVVVAFKHVWPDSWGPRLDYVLLNAVRALLDVPGGTLLMLPRLLIAALSSLYKHLVRHGHAARNPVSEVERPAINRDEGSTLAFAKTQARKLLDLPAEETIAGLRDRAILSVGLQVGLRRAEIAALTVGDLHQNRGYDSLRVTRKGGRRDALAINPQTAARLRAYLDAAGHAGDSEGAMFRPLRHNGKQDAERRHMDPDAIDRVVRKYAAALGLDRGYSAHSMRATFITTALENGAQLEDVQKAAGHRDPSTTKLYDRRGYNPEKAASFFAIY